MYKISNVSNVFPVEKRIVECSDSRFQINDKGTSNPAG